jgi:hemerythrin-like metal-binding protein
MALLDWNDTLLIGVAEMDQQHQRWIDIINKLYDAMRQGKGDDVKRSILDELLAYTKVHFSAEERLMQEYGYPQLNEHRQLHESFTAEIVRFKAKLQAGRTVASVTLGSFLKGWLIKHVTQIDKKYGQFICVGTEA